MRPMQRCLCPQTIAEESYQKCSPEDQRQKVRALWYDFCTA